MKILLSGKFTNVNGRRNHAFGGGGSGSYFQCLQDAFLDNGFDVINTDDPSKFRHEKFDLIVTSHGKLNAIKRNKGFKVQVCHGVHPKAEQPMPGADAYISISNEVQNHLKIIGYDSFIIPQPVKVHEYIEAKKIPENILFITNRFTKNIEWYKNLFLFCNFFKKQNLWKIDRITLSNPETSIDRQIIEADLVITIGRGVIESMAYSKNVIVADNRSYIGPKGDGYLNGDNVNKSMTFNYNGKAFGFNATTSWMHEQIKKYNYTDAMILNRHANTFHSGDVIAKKFIDLIR